MDERDLIRKSQAGDLQAFERLVLARRAQVFRVARQIVGDDEEAKDIAQMVFVRLWQTLPRYREGGSFGAYLHRITVNLAFDAVRKRESRAWARGMDTQELEKMAGTDRPSGNPEPGEIQRIFGVLSRRLGSRQKAAFVLREIEGMSTQDVSEILGMSESTVRNHVHAARKVLQEGLRKQFPEYARGKGGREE